METVGAVFVKSHVVHQDDRHKFLRIGRTIRPVSLKWVKLIENLDDPVRIGYFLIQLIDIELTAATFPEFFAAWRRDKERKALETKINQANREKNIKLETKINAKRVARRAKQDSRECANITRNMSIRSAAKLSIT